MVFSLIMDWILQTDQGEKTIVSWVKSYKLIMEKNHSELDLILQNWSRRKTITSWIESYKLIMEKNHNELDWILQTY